MQFRLIAVLGHLAGMHNCFTKEREAGIPTKLSPAGLLGVAH